jgi:hypothetical protein
MAANAGSNSQMYGHAGETREPQTHWRKVSPQRPDTTGT